MCFSGKSSCFNPMAFIFVFLLYSHLFLTQADQLFEPPAGSAELNRRKPYRSFLAGFIAVIITLALIAFKFKKQSISTKGSAGSFSLETFRCFSFDEIVSATQNFSRSSFIGHRGFGDVYAGIMDEGRHTVAVKRLSLDFLNQVKALSQLRHDNLVSLIGYCNESSDMILVYEFMPLGTLADNLCINTSLSWEQRLRICIGAARGLDYLHTGTARGVIHGDLKSSNILLDENYKPRISDFGLTTSTSQKKDVCSFGVVLLEVLCGKTPEISRDQENQSQLISWAKGLIGEVDPRINGQMSPECLKEFVGMCEICLNDDPKMRPTMAQLVARLELLLDNYVYRERNPTTVRGSEFPETPAIAAEPETREMGETSSSVRYRKKTRSMFRDEVQQCYYRYEFDTATSNFSNSKILCYGYNGAYRIYSGTYFKSNKASSLIIYRGKFMRDDISKLSGMSHLRHPNLASVAGYCCIDDEAVVGYKDEGHNVLHQHLIHSSLSWSQRLNICIGVAGALVCIHSANIIHGGISPTAVIVDANLSAHLASFSSVLCQFDVATLQYLPPDIAGYPNQTQKSDVYMFGLLLLVVFCGRKTNYSSGYPFLLPDYIREAKKLSILYKSTDMDFKEIAVECLSIYLNIAFWCLRSAQADRPSMDTVVERLNEAQLLQPPNSTSTPAAAAALAFEEIFGSMWPKG